MLIPCGRMIGGVTRRKFAAAKLIRKTAAPGAVGPWSVTLWDDMMMEMASGYLPRYLGRAHSWMKRLGGGSILLLRRSLLV